MALNIKSIVDKEKNRLKSMLIELEARKSQLNPSQRKKLESIEKIFNNVVDKKEHSSDEKKNIRQQIKDLKKTD